MENEKKQGAGIPVNDNELDSVSGGAGVYENRNKTKVNNCPVCFSKPTGRRVMPDIYEFECSCGSVFKIGYVNDKPSGICFSMIRGVPQPEEQWLDADRVAGVS